MHTKHTTIYTIIQNRTNRIWKNVIRETDIQAANFIWSVYLLIMVDTLLLRPSLHLSTLHFFLFKLHPTTLHYTCRRFTSSHLNFTQLHFTTLSFGLNPFKFPTAPFHLTSLHFTSLHFTALLDDFCHTSVPFTSSCLLLLS